MYIYIYIYIYTYIKKYKKIKTKKLNSARRGPLVYIKYMVVQLTTKINEVRFV